MSDEAHSAAAWDGAREVCGQIHIRGKSLADWLDAPGVSPVDGWVEAKPSTTLIAEDIRAGVAKVIDRARQNAVAGALGEVWEAVRDQGGRSLADGLAKALQDRLGSPAGQVQELLRRADG